MGQKVHDKRMGLKNAVIFFGIDGILTCEDVCKNHGGIRCEICDNDCDGVPFEVGDGVTGTVICKLIELGMQDGVVAISNELVDGLEDFYDSLVHCCVSGDVLKVGDTAYFVNLGMKDLHGGILLSTKYKVFYDFLTAQNGKFDERLLSYSESKFHSPRLIFDMEELFRCAICQNCKNQYRISDKPDEEKYAEDGTAVMFEDDDCSPFSERAGDSDAYCACMFGKSGVFNTSCEFKDKTLPQNENYVLEIARFIANGSHEHMNGLDD